MKLLRAGVSVIVLAGSTLAPCQNTFIVQFDSVQAGRDASGRSVMEIDSGLLVFAWQRSSDGTELMRSAVYKLGPDGSFLDRVEIGTGDPASSGFGNFDPVARSTDGDFVSAITHTYGYEYAIELSRFNGVGELMESVPVLFSPGTDSTVLVARQTRATVDGGHVLCGASDAPGATAEALLVKVSADGTVQWQHTYGAGGQTFDAISVAPYLDGGYVLAGYRLPANLTNLGWVIRTDSEGNELWRRFFGNDGGGWGAVRITADSCILTFSSYGESGWPFGWRQHLLTKWNAEGQIVWQTRSNYYSNVTAYDLEVLPDQSIIGVGTFSTVIGLTKYSAGGDSLWCRFLRVFDNLGGHSAYDVELASDGGFLLTGEASQAAGDPHPGLQTIFVIKTDSFGCVVPGCQNVGVEEYVIDLQEHLHISPNPASDLVNVLLELPEGGVVHGQAQVQLVDASGSMVLEEKVQQNFNQLRTTLDVSALPSGTYYLHLRDGKRWLAGGKVVVQR